MPDYYKSRHLADPILYIEDEDGYRTISPTGQTVHTAGPIPRYIFESLEPISQEQAEHLKAERHPPLEANRHTCEICGIGPAVRFRFGEPHRLGWVTVFEGYLCRRHAEETYQEFQGAPGMMRFLRGLLSPSPNALNYHMGLSRLDSEDSLEQG